MTCTTKFCGAIEAVGWAVAWTDPVGGPDAVTIPDGTYYVLGDGTASDLLEVLEVAVNAVGFIHLVAAIDDDGIVSLATDAATATITWTTAGEALRDVLRFSGATQALTTTPVAGARTAKYVVTSSVPVRVDTPTTMGRQSAAESDSFSRSVLTLSSTSKRYTLGIRYGGPHRSTSWGPYDAWLSFFELVIRPGSMLRWYPDATVDTIYAQQSNPFGYHTGVMISPSQWTPRELEAGWHRWYLADLVLQLQDDGTGSYPTTCPAAAAGGLTTYTLLATLLASSGSAGDRCQLETAGGDLIGIWRYSTTLGWVPDGLIVLTASGTDTALGVGAAAWEGSPSWASGVACDVVTDDCVVLRLWNEFLNTEWATVTMDVGCTITMGAPAAGSNDFVFAGVEVGGSAKADGAGVLLVYSSATNVVAYPVLVLLSSTGGVTAWTAPTAFETAVWAQLDGLQFSAAVSNGTATTKWGASCAYALDQTAGTLEDAYGDSATNPTEAGPTYKASGVVLGVSDYTGESIASVKFTSLNISISEA